MAGDSASAAKVAGEIGRSEVKGEGRVSTMLRRVAPGTELREALDNIISADSGALIVIGDTPAVDGLCDGGFTLNVPFTPQRLFELTKMDGAILLDEDCRTILRANVHLVPDSSLLTVETGMRHRTAERVSRQTSALVISVSQRRNVVSLYRAGRKVTVEDVTVVLAKANQALQTLQRYRTRLDEVVSRLTLLEFEDAATVGEVVTVIQRSELVQRVAREVDRYVNELGTEGRLVAMQAEEETVNVVEEHALLLRDYVVASGQRQASVVRFLLSEMSQDQVLDDLAVVSALGFQSNPDVLEQHVNSRGYRVLRRIPSLPATVVNRLVERFTALAAIARATEEQLDEVDGVGARRARVIAEGLRRLREASAS
jgi:diadenylate cyclase